MKLVESKPLNEEDITNHKKKSVKVLKSIIQDAEIGVIPENLLYELEDYLWDKVYYLKFQKDIYSKYPLTLEQKYFLTTYYMIIWFKSSDDDDEGHKLLKDACRTIGYENEEFQDPDFRKRFYYALNEPRKLCHAERVLMHKTGKDFNIKPERQAFRDRRKI